MFNEKYTLSFQNGEKLKCNRNLMLFKKAKIRKNMKKNIKKSEIDIGDLNNCKNPPNFFNSKKYWIKIKWKNIHIWSATTFLRISWIFEILWNRFLFREKISEIITKIKCFKW